MPRKHLMVLLVLLAAACATEVPEPPATRTPPSSVTRVTETRLVDGVPATVRGVVDARTVEFPNGARVRISLLAPPAACWAAASLAFARTALLDRRVRLTTVTPGEVNVELADGSDYALLAVRQGVLRAEGAAGPLADAEAAAARENKGLWGPPCEGMDVGSG